jgi:hypothetical protein
MIGMPDGDVASPDGTLEVRGDAHVWVMKLTCTVGAIPMGGAVVGEVVWFWFHALKAHDWIGRRGTTIGVGVRKGGSLASVECGHRPDRIGGLRFRADGVDVLKYVSWGTGMDDVLFHGDEFIGGTTEFLLGESETAKCSGAVVKKGAVPGDFGGYARVT